MRVNLLKERNQAYTINWLEVSAIVTLIVVIMVCAIFFYYLNTQVDIRESKIVSLDNQINSLLVRVEEYEQLKERVEQLEEIKAQIDTLKYVWDDVLLEMGYVIPAQTMVNRMVLSDNNLYINGMAINNQKVLDLIDNMKTSTMYNEIKLIDITYTTDADYNIEAVVDIEAGDK